MSIPAILAMIMSAVFAAACLGVALMGFMSLDEIADPVQLQGATRSAWWWMFLGAVGVVAYMLSGWNANKRRGN
jgi:hypothetical protein